MRRSRLRRLKDTIAFPLRAFVLFENDRFGLTALMPERFDYAASQVRGYCLDVGCGKRNRFVSEFLGGNGRGIDVFPYEGLTKDNLVEDMTHFPFPDAAFESVTFIANINHVPKSQRDAELREAYRCLKAGGNIIVTMGNPLAEILVHQVLWAHDKLFGSDYDLDGMRDRHEDEEYYLTDKEIVSRLTWAGFQGIEKKFFPTQWCLNHMFVGWKN